MTPGTLRERWFREILRAPGIPDSTRVLLHLLATDYMDDDGRVVVKKSVLAEDLDRGYREITRRQTSAIAAGFLARTQYSGRGKPPVYQAVFPGEVLAASVAPPTGSTALYRYFDVDDRLLYVGVTNQVSDRQKSHARSSVWMEFAVRSTIERHPTRSAAEEAERDAIKNEDPLFNRQFNESEEARNRAQEYLVSCGRPDLMLAAPPTRPEAWKRATAGAAKRAAIRRAARERRAP